MAPTGDDQMTTTPDEHMCPQNTQNSIITTINTVSAAVSADDRNRSEEVRLCHHHDPLASEGREESVPILSKKVGNIRIL